MEQPISDNSMDSSDDDSLEGYPGDKMMTFLLVSHFIILLIGLPGNCLVIRVYWSKIPKTSTHVLIMGLAFADFFVCLLRIADILEVVADIDIPWIIAVVESVGIASSVMITAAIAADRYDCICRPRNRFFTFMRSKVTVLGILIASVIINIPNVINGFSDMKYDVVDTISLVIMFACFVAALGMITFCYTKVYITIRQHVRVNVATSVHANNLGSTDNGAESCPHHDASHRSVIDMGNSSGINQMTKTNTTYISNIPNKDNCAPCEATRASLNRLRTHCRVSVQESVTAPQQETGDDQQVWAISRHARPCKGRGPNAGTGGMQRKTTNMLFITSLVFLLTWTPNWINVAFLSFGGDMNPKFVQTWDALTSIPYYINNAVNPLIYGLLNRRFRKDCKELLRKMKVFGCCKGGRH